MRASSAVTGKDFDEALVAAKRAAALFDRSGVMDEASFWQDPLKGYWCQNGLKSTCECLLTWAGEEVFLEAVMECT